MDTISRKQKIIIGVMIAFLIAVGGCYKVHCDVKEAEQQAYRQRLIERYTNEYNEGIELLEQMDFQQPDKEMTEKAAMNFVSITSTSLEFASDPDEKECVGTVRAKCRDADTLYNMTNALRELAERGSLDRVLTNSNSMFKYYLDQISDNYHGPCYEKILAFKKYVNDYYEQTLVPRQEQQKAAQLAARQARQAEARSQQRSSHSDDYDDDYDDYDHDGYMEEVFEDNASDYVKGNGKGSSGNAERPRRVYRSDGSYYWRSK